VFKYLSSLFCGPSIYRREIRKLVITPALVPVPRRSDYVYGAVNGAPRSMIGDSIES
jgi:hypothetical protein